MDAAGMRKMQMLIKFSWESVNRKYLTEGLDVDMRIILK